MNACPVQCIVMRRDREGFDYPVANPDRCIGCGKCEVVCPVLHPSDVLEPLEVLAARSGEYVAASSSGGVFPELASNKKVTISNSDKYVCSIDSETFKVTGLDYGTSKLIITSVDRHYVQYIINIGVVDEDITETILNMTKKEFDSKCNALKQKLGNINCTFDICKNTNFYGNYVGNAIYYNKCKN
jgi:Fe-S-cluster-containing hydrogenase component 2